MKKNHTRSILRRMYKVYIGLISIFCISIFFGCDNNEFRVHESGLEYKILTKSKSKTKIKTGDYLELEFGYYTDKDSLLFHTREFGENLKMRVAENSHQGGCFEDALRIMNPGDKYIFKIPVDSFFARTKNSPTPMGVQPGTELYFNIRVIRLIPESEIIKERELLNKQMEEQEQMLLEQFLADNQIEMKPSRSGIYIIKYKKGRGRKPRRGNRLTVHYTGKLIDGKVFDSSVRRNEPFTFKLGAEEVIKGWNETFLKLRKGDKATVIIPSKLAYGKDGLSTIIPPYASLIFDVELIDIK